DTATTEIYPLSLHDALPICSCGLETEASCLCCKNSRRRVAESTSPKIISVHCVTGLLKNPKIAGAFLWSQSKARNHPKKRLSRHTAESIPPNATSNMDRLCIMSSFARSKTPRH